MLKTREVVAIAVVAVGALAGSAIAEDVTITSYFPSPRGVFEELIVTNHAYLATTAAQTVQVGSNATPVGTTPKFSVVNGAYSVSLAGTSATATPTVMISGSSATLNPEVVFARALGGAADATLAATGANILMLSGAELHVDEVAAGSPQTGHVRIDGSFFCNQAIDVSEHLPVGMAQAAMVSSGHVMIVDPQSDESMVLSHRPYDSSVVGVISTQPGLLLGAEHEGMALALTGRVPTKVTAENGPIRRGDLLVTASKPGFAMRADIDKVRSGMVIGKALGELAEGEGTVVVLVNLQ